MKNINSIYMICGRQISKFIQQLYFFKKKTECEIPCGVEKTFIFGAISGHYTKVLIPTKFFRLMVATIPGRLRTCGNVQLHLSSRPEMIQCSGLSSGTKSTY